MNRGNKLVINAFFLAVVFSLSSSIIFAAAPGAPALPSADSAPTSDAINPDTSPKYVFPTLISDYIDRFTGNRMKTNPEDLYTGTTTSPDNTVTADTLNPFRFTPLEPLQAVKKIDGINFNPFAKATLTDPLSLNKYTETQALWLGGKGMGKRLANGQVSRYSGVGYQAKFANYPSVSEHHGILYCAGILPTPVNDACEPSNIMASHRMPIKFLGSDWRLIGMNPPASGTATANYLYPVGGGSVVLAKESGYIIATPGEMLPAGVYKVVLDDVEVVNNESVSVFSIRNSDGTTIAKVEVMNGITHTFIAANGYAIRIHVYKAQSGYSMSKWSEFAVLSDRIYLGDSQRVSYNEQINQEWKARVLWKNKNAEAANISALREIFIYSDHSSVLNKDFVTGDYLPILSTPQPFRLVFNGLKPTTYDGLSYVLHNNANALTVAGPDNAVSCNSTSMSSTRLLRVSTGVYKGFSIKAGYGQSGGTYQTDTVYYDLINKKLYFKAGTTVDCYYWASNNEIIAQYKTVGSAGNKINGGAISFGNPDLQSAKFAIFEDAGRYNATMNKAVQMYFYAKRSPANNWYFGSSNSTGIVNFIDATGQTTMQEAPYMSDRGSTFAFMSSDAVGFKTSKTVGSLMWTLIKPQTTPADTVGSYAS